MCMCRPILCNSLLTELAVAASKCESGYHAGSGILDMLKARIPYENKGMQTL